MASCLHQTSSMASLNALGLFSLIKKEQCLLMRLCSIAKSDHHVRLPRHFGTHTGLWPMRINGTCRESWTLFHFRFVFWRMVSTALRIWACRLKTLWSLVCSSHVMGKRGFIANEWSTVQEWHHDNGDDHEVDEGKGSAVVPQSQPTHTNILRIR